MDRKEKLSHKLLSTKVKSIRPYKSRSSRPCDFCRKRKTCCIIKDLIPCMACVGFNKGRCTFLEGPIKRTKKVEACEKGVKLSDSYKASVDDIYQSIPANVSNGQVEVSRVKQPRLKNPIKKPVSSLVSNSNMAIMPSIASSSSMSSSGSHLYPMTNSAFQYMGYNSPQSMYSSNTSPAIPNAGNISNSSVFFGQAIPQPRLQDEDPQDSFDQSQYSLATSEYPPLPSVSIQSEIGALPQNRFRPQSAQAQTIHTQVASHASTSYGTAIERPTREQLLRGCAQSAPCDASFVDGYFEQPSPFVSQGNVANNTNAPTHKGSQYSTNVSYDTSSTSNAFPSYSHHNTSKFQGNPDWSFQSQPAQKFTPELLNTSSFNQQPTPMSAASNMRSLHTSFNEDIFAMDDGNIGEQRPQGDSFHQKNHQQYQDRIHQSESLFHPEYYDSFGITAAQEPDNFVNVAKYLEIPNNMASSKQTPTSAQNGASRQLLAPLYSQLFLPLDHAIPEPLYLVD